MRIFYRMLTLHALGVMNALFAIDNFYGGAWWQVLLGALNAYGVFLAARSAQRMEDAIRAEMADIMKRQGREK